MVAKVIGIKTVDFTTKENERISGSKIQITRKPTSREVNVDGEIATDVWVKTGFELPIFKFGKEYEFIYESDGKHSYLVAIQEAV